jgi:hypothetical protein
MGSYVTAYLAFGVTVTEPEWDINAEYVEPDEDADEFDLYDHLRSYPLLNDRSAGDSQWDENPDVIYVQRGCVSVDEESVGSVDLRALLTPTPPELASLADAVAGLPPDKRVSAPGWLLFWTRG